MTFEIDSLSKTCYPIDRESNRKEVRQMEDNKRQRTGRWAVAVTLALTALLLWGLWSTGFFQAVRSPETLRRYIEGSAPYSHLVFFAIQLSSVILAPIPSNLTAAAGGLLFGPLWAFLLTMAAVTLGSVIVFLLGRALGRPFAERFAASRHLERYEEVIRRKGKLFLFLAFLFPLFPDDLLCVIAGLTDLPFRHFLLLVVIARPWGLLAASALGGAAPSIPLWGMLLLGGGLAALFVLALKYGDKFQAALLAKLKKR